MVGPSTLEGAIAKNSAEARQQGTEPQLRLGSTPSRLEAMDNGQTVGRARAGGISSSTLRVSVDVGCTNRISVGINDRID
jgi:hypothetical protein